MYEKISETVILNTETGISFPTQPGNNEYKVYLEWLSEGNEEPIYTPPPLSDHELKLKGVEFEGVMCSATSEDMWGLSAIKDWIRSGQTTDFQFRNGNTLTLNSNNIDDFESVWIPFRANFF